MTPDQHDPLRADLARLTEWTEPRPTPELWKAALRTVRSRELEARRRPWYARKVPGLAVAVLGLVAALFVLIPLFEPVTRQARTTIDLERLRSTGIETLGGVQAQSRDRNDQWKSGFLLNGRTDGTLGGVKELSPGTARAGERVPSSMPQGTPPPAATPDTERQVIRRATIELTTKDVRAAFLKAQAVLSAAGEEFVENSSITGSGREMKADLTLRVRAERISDVLNELRGLGKVQDEHRGGEDVTSQVVDVEARLRNEQRVEKELLELLEKRTDAPLKEVLEVRNALSNVRQQIESMVAQRDKLAHLVSLATVLVIIRSDDAPPPVEETLGERFLHSIGDSWHLGLVGLIDSLGRILRILMAGLIWWILLALGAAFAWRKFRRVWAESEATVP